MKKFILRSGGIPAPDSATDRGASELAPDDPINVPFSMQVGNFVSLQFNDRLSQFS